MTQTYATHRVLPLPYIVCGAALLAYAAYKLWHLAGQPACGTAIDAAAAIALLVVWFKARRNPQIMQDRIIRLEMQVRLRQLLPAERQGDLARLTLPQLVGLRFASDRELPALVGRVLAGELATQDAIKHAVQEWQPDELRV